MLAVCCRATGAGARGSGRAADTLRSFALVLAIDDAQWLDRPSADALEFCIRRLEHEPVSILLTVRTDDPVPFGLDYVLPPDRLSRLRLGPLSLGAIGEILRSRLGAVLLRYALTGLYDTCGGNPFYALECARLLLSCPRMSLTKEPIPSRRTSVISCVAACSGSRRMHGGWASSSQPEPTRASG